MPLDEQTLLQMLAAVGRGEAQRLQYEGTDFRLTISRAGLQTAAEPTEPWSQPRAVAPEATPTAKGPVTLPGVAQEESINPEQGAVIRSPLAGTFYRLPTPDAPPFARDGETVAEDQTLGLVEVMKLYTSVKAGRAARVRRFVAENGAPVAAGQALVVLEWV